MESVVNDNPDAENPEVPDMSKTLTSTIVGEHEHTIVGYSLLKGIGDGEPIASDRFTVGGHEWVLLFYPDGKKSSSEAAHHAHPNLLGHFGHHGRTQTMRQTMRQFASAMAAGDAPMTQEEARQALRAQAGMQAQGAQAGNPQTGAAAGNANNNAGNNAAGGENNANAAAGGAPNGADQGPLLAGVVPQHGAQGYRMIHPPGLGPGRVGLPPNLPEVGHFAIRRENEVQYAALFVALIGETSRPMGVVHTSEGHIVRAFHHFTLVDQSNRGRDITKGRRREQGAVKISCARQDPNARNCHGYRKFIKRSVLENPDSGFLLNDTIKIKYKIELVVMSGGAFCRPEPEQPLPIVQIPEPRLSEDFAELLKSGEGSDFTFLVEGEEMPAHRLIVASRSPVFKALLDNDMREGKEKKIAIHDVRAPAFQILLHFVYTDKLPEEVSGDNLQVTMAQHLLSAADRFELPRLRAICEKHLCETVDIVNAATTLTLADENHATELRRHCLDFVALNLSQVMNTSGFEYMVQRCPHLQRAILEACSKDPMARSPGAEGSGKKRDWDQEGGSSSRREKRVRFHLNK